MMNSTQIQCRQMRKGLLERKLYLACTTKNHDQVIELLKQGADPKSKHAQDHTGSSLLHVACSNGWLDVVKLLVEEYAFDLQSQDFQGRTPLHCVRCVDIARYLVEEQKCSAKVVDNKHKTPVEYACQRGHVAMVLYLVDKQGTVDSVVGQKVLAMACQTQDMNLVKTIIGMNLFGNSWNSWQFIRQGGYFTIMQRLIRMEPDIINEMNSNALVEVFSMACSNNSLDIVQLLAERCDGNHQVHLKDVKDSNGRTLLHHACKEGYVEAVCHLIHERKCATDSRDGNNKTPLHYACEYNHIEVVQHFITLPTYKQISNNPHHEVFFLACKRGYLSLTKKAIISLPRAGSQKNVIDGPYPWPLFRDKDQRIPLHHACLGGHGELVLYFMTDQRTDPKATDKYGLTPLNYAYLYGHKDIIATLTCKEVAKVLPSWLKSIPSLSDILFLACKFGQLGTVQYIIEELKFNPNIINEVQQTPLYVACQNRHTNVIEYLLGLPSCTPDSSDKAEVFLTACENGNLSLIKDITEKHQWNPNITSEDGQTPIIYVACLHKHLDIVRYLLSLPNYKPVNDVYLTETLFTVCKKGHVEMVKFAIENDKCDPRRLRNRYQRTLLHFMCKYGHTSMVQSLIEKYGCNPDVQDEAKRTPLHFACLFGHLKIVRYLACRQDCNLNASNRFQRTPLHYACLQGNNDIVQYLINEKKCNPAVEDKKKRTPLHLTCMRGHINIVHYLIQKVGCFPSVKDQCGRTPLHYACQYGHSDIVEYLIIERKCKPEITDVGNNTPLHYVCHNQRLDLVTCLFKVSGELLDINAENKEAFTPFELIKSSATRHKILHLLFEINNKILKDKEIIKLIERFIDRSKWDPCQTDDNGENALHFASKSERKDVIQYLLTKTRCNVNIRNKKGESPLMLTNTYEIIVIFVEHGADVSVAQCRNMIISNKKTEEETIRTMRYLIQRKLWDPNHVCDGNNALQWACKANRPQIVKYLLSEASCDPNKSNNTSLNPLKLTKSPDIIIELFRHGADIDQVCRKVFYALKDEDTLLVIERLAKAPTILWNPSQPSKNGNTALHHVCIANRPKILQYLLAELKCNPEICNSNGMTPLDLTSNPECIQHLLQNGADLECVYQKLIDTVTEETGLEIIKHLFASSALNGRTKHGDNILHYACRANKPRIIQFLLCETDIDLNAQNSAGEFPLYSINIDIPHIISNSTEHRALQIVTHIIDTQEFHCNGITLQGVTALHFACKFNKPSIVNYLLSEANYSPNIVNLNGEAPLHLASDPKIIDDLIKHGANPSDVYQTHGTILGTNCQPLRPSVKVFVVGNPSVGKSTLVAAIQKEISFLVRAFTLNKKVSAVDEKTAGVVPHEFDSKRYQCGPVTLYDFAGHREFYSSHAALLQTAVQSTPPVFLLVINLSDSDKDIEQNIQFWLSFINNPCISVSSKPHLIVIGSHADKLKARGGDQLLQKLTFVKSVVSRISNEVLLFAGFVAMDCRYFESAGMTELGHLLRKSCDSVRKQEPISFNSHCCHTLLLSQFCGPVAIQLKDVKSHLLTVTDETQNLDSQLANFIPTNLHSLSIICNDLHDRGHILFLMNTDNLEKSWIILKKADLLAKVTGTIFAPSDFKQYCQIASSTGVVPLSKLTDRFPDQNPEMLVGFLSHLEYCHEIADQEVLKLIEEHQKIVETVHIPNERYFFFPGLVTLEIPDGVWDEQEPEKFDYVSGWIIQCTQPEHFFTSRFLQVLILRLAFYFALIPLESAEDNFPAIRRKCSVWKRGIFWGSRQGIEALVELLPNSKAIVLLIRGQESCLFEYIQLRSACARRIRSSITELCKQLETNESLLIPSEASKYPENPTTYFSMTEVAKAITIPSGCPSVVTSTGKCLCLSSLLTLEPYASLGATILYQLSILSSTDSEISDEFISSFVNQVNKPREMQVFIKMLSSDPSRQAHVQSLSDALYSWRENCQGTYQLLQEKIDKFSMLTASNILDLVGISKDSVIIDTTPAEKDQDCMSRKPQLQELQQCGSVKVIDTAAPHWEELAITLGFRHYVIETVKRDYKSDARGACRRMFLMWIEHKEENLIGPVTWVTLIQCLEDAEFSSLAEALKGTLDSDFAATKVIS